MVSSIFSVVGRIRESDACSQNKYQVGGGCRIRVSDLHGYTAFRRPCRCLRWVFNPTYACLFAEQYFQVASALSDTSIRPTRVSDGIRLCGGKPVRRRSDSRIRRLFAEQYFQVASALSDTSIRPTRFVVQTAFNARHQDTHPPPAGWLALRAGCLRPTRCLGATR